jgi:ribosomal protein L7/L12
MRLADHRPNALMRNVVDLNLGATPVELAELERWLGAAIPAGLRTLLEESSVVDAAPIAEDLVDWVRAGCPLADDDRTEEHALTEVVLVGRGSADRLALIALLRRELGIDLQRARELVDGAPIVLAKRPAFLADRLAGTLRAAGADVHTVRVGA